MTTGSRTPAADLSGLTWRKSTRSGPQGGNCVEVARLRDGRIAVRDSRRPQGPALLCAAAGWDAFLARARAGRPAGR